MISAIGIKSSYSFLESSIKLDDLFKNAEYDYIFLNDNNLHALYKFLSLSKQSHKKGVVGLTITLKYLNEDLKVLVYARNDSELNDLIRLSSFNEHSDEVILNDLNRVLDLVIIIPINQTYIVNNYEDSQKLNDLIEVFKTKFKNFYIGISYQSDFLKNKIAKIFANIDVKTLPVYETTYLDKDDLKVYETLTKIGKKRDEINLFKHLLSKDELMKLYENDKILFKNMSNVFKDVSYTYIDHQYELPKFISKEKKDSKILLKEISLLSLNNKLKENNPKYQIYLKRLNYELNIIDQMGFNDYFLIVSDFVNYAKNNNILVGPGRGSAAGSLVAYLTNITEVDPIKYNLLFERFLNLKRITLPDIDLDFPDDKRDLVIDYVKNKYGKNHVITISTFSNFGFRSSIRDVAKTIDLETSRLESIIKGYENDRLDESDYVAFNLIELSNKLTGLPRQSGTHAAGIILSKDDLTQIIPLTKSPHNMFQSQLEASDLEAMGFLKIDFLGLRNLTIIDEITKALKIDKPFIQVPLNDKKTFEILQKGDTNGIFQLESEGIRNVLKKLKVKTFDDLVLLLALYRPGPMDLIDTLISRKENKEEIKLDNSIDEILKPTYGIIIYQEQIMEIARVFAGFSLNEADMLRRGISSKDKTLLMSYKEEFIRRSLKKGHDEDIAIKIFEYIENFARYGFNKSHSVSYALISYQMAYLKANFFLLFMSKLLTNSINSIVAIKELISEIKNKGYEIYPPNINYSTLEFTLYQKGVLLPLSMIKGINKNTLNKIIKERDQGPFKDYDDFKSRLNSIITENNLINIINSNALDLFKINKNTMLHDISLSSSQYKMFLPDYQRVSYNELNFAKLRENEFNSLGLNILYSDEIVLNKLNTKFQQKPIIFKGHFINGIVLLLSYKQITTKKGDDMAFLTISNGKEIQDFTLFPNEFIKYRKLLQDSFILINAQKGRKGYIIDKIEKVEEI